MRKYLVAIILIGLLTTASNTYAQLEATVQEGEFGISLGAGHYFGDLNTRASVSRPKVSMGAFFRKQFGNYIGLRVGGHFMQLGYSDTYSKNDYQKRRNLSFNTNVWELALQGDFNFYRFIPGDPEHSFSPYVTIGAGVFNYDPYAYLRGEKQFLRPLGTEGQGSSLYPDRKQYSSMAFCFPVGVGVKYNITPKVNIAFEITHRFTTTDYLDDVSSTYAGAAAFPPGPGGVASTAFLLQDRSYETGEPIGIAGRQRGWSKQKDQFITAEVAISFNLSSYKCPTAR